MCLSYLVENFFLVILRTRIVFVAQKFSKKIDFSSQIFEILEKLQEPVLATLYEKLARYFFLTSEN
jgi:hypothetical protein